MEKHTERRILVQPIPRSQVLYIDTFIRWDIAQIGFAGTRKRAIDFSAESLIPLIFRSLPTNLFTGLRR
jgi:hypothetical protein